jgi:hypothetical protein
MKIENQVCSLEQAIKFKQLGVHQGSFFAYISEGELLSKHSPNLDLMAIATDFTAAYTVAELGEMLPDYLVIDSYRMHPRFHKQEQHNSPALWTARYGKPEDLDIPDFDAKNEAQCRAAMLIHLLESGLTTPTEINNRLKQ